jgi:DNA-binding NtrC family response regulator
MIHLLDDSRYDLELITKCLEKNKIYDYKSFTNEELFLQELNTNVVVVLIDHLISAGKTGLEIMKEVVERNPICYPIIVSGNENTKVILEYVDNDCFRYILKSDKDYLSKIVKAVKQAEDRIERIKKYFDASSTATDT